jgi:hypothetical protein
MGLLYLYIRVGILICVSNSISPLRISEAFTPVDVCSGNLRNKCVGEVADKSRQIQSELKLHCKLQLATTYQCICLIRYNNTTPVCLIHPLVPPQCSSTIVAFTFFYIFLPCIMQWFLVNDQRDAQISFYVFIFIYNSLHVSRTSCSSSGETNCINTTSDNCHSVLVAVSCTGWEFTPNLHTAMFIYQESTVAVHRCTRCMG